MIPTWNGRDLLKDCLLHLRAQTLPHRVTVIDNASSDGTNEMINGQFPEVNYLKLDNNYGFGAAVNRGIQNTDADLIALINNDVNCEPQCLQKLTEPFNDSSVGMAAGLTVIPDTELIDSLGIELAPTLAAYNFSRKLPVNQELDTTHVAGPSGALACYRREALTQAGNFDENIFAYLEDVDLCLRVLNHGFTSRVVAAAKGTHIGGATSGVGSEWQQRMFGFARGYTLRRYDLLRSRYAARVLFIETVVVLSSLLRRRKLTALSSRVAGWKKAKGLTKTPLPKGAINTDITLYKELLRLRSH